MAQRSKRRPPLLVAFALGAAGCITLWAQIQIRRITDTVEWFLPLDRAAEVLEQRYALPVTYEGPRLRWSGELQFEPQFPGGKPVLGPRRHTLVLPPDLFPPQVPAGEAVRKVVEAYQQQHPTFTRYKVLESSMGFHIVADMVPDEAGVHVPSINPLDLRVDVPSARRTAAEHISALCDALTRAGGLKIKTNASVSFERLYAANGYVLPKGPVGDVRSFIEFEWGVRDAVAREALIQFLSGSATTLSWRFTCSPPVPAEEPFCMLNLVSLMVGPERRVVSYDRCKGRCRALPGPDGRPLPLPPQAGP